MRRRSALCLAIVGLVVASAGTSTAHAAQACGEASWVTSWATSPHSAGGSFRDQTLRMIVTPHAAGSKVRLRLSNRFGTAPVMFAAVHVGMRRERAQLLEGTNRVVTFSGGRDVAVPAGAEVVSDTVDLAVRPFEDLAVSIRLDGASGPATTHLAAYQTSYVTPAGSPARGDEEGGEAYTGATTSWHYLAGVDVLTPETGGAVAVIGDSITDGGNSSTDANRRWPDELQRRVLADPRLRGLSVLNAGIVGNQVTRDHPFFGQAAVTRVRRDVFDLTGLRAVIVFEGTNDIAGNTPPRATADELIDGYRSLIAAARARGLAVLGTTITPASGNQFPLHGDARAAEVRRAVNAWIRTSGAFDAVIDADAALRDKSGAERLDAAYDSGDGLHPNDAGMRALAEAVPLPALAALACGAPAASPGHESTAAAPVPSAGTPAPRRGVPRVRVRASATRGRRRLRIAISGSIDGHAEACPGGRVAVTIKARRRTISARRVAVSEGCTFRATVTFRERRRLAAGRRLRVLVELLPTGEVQPVRAPVRSVTVRWQRAPAGTRQPAGPPSPA